MGWLERQEVTEEYIARHLAESCPAVVPILTVLAPIPRLTRRPNPVGEAVVRVVIGQMMAGKTAATLYTRAQEAARKGRKEGVWDLDYDALRAVGLSKAKCRTIIEFGGWYRSNENAAENWASLAAADLIVEVKKFWGMSDWTASILALFHFGHEDIFPAGDSSLVRALTELDSRQPNMNVRTDPQLASPFRSYLALYLWKALDSGVIGRMLPQ